MEECADLLDQKAEQYGLSKKGEKFNNFAVGGGVDHTRPKIRGQ